MSWSYNVASLGTSTAAERLNAVRYLVGDTDYNDQQVQDEEINFALGESGDNVYYAASFVADTLAARYSRLVTTKLDGALSAEYSDLSKQYRLLSTSLKEQGQRYGGTALGLAVGGVRITDINTVRDDEDRVTPAFRRDRFRYPYAGDYLPDYTEE